MRPADLVVLATAHGIDISHTVASETNTRGAASKRRRTREERWDGIPVRETVEGKQTRVARAREWTHAEAGMAAKDVPRMPWLAALYSFAGDRTHDAELHRGLTLKAIRVAEQHQWPWQVPMLTGRGYYIERLAELVLDHDAMPRVFVQAPGLFPIYMNVPERVWSKPLFGYFLELQQQYGRWLSVAQGCIAQWLRAGECLQAPEDRRIVRSELPRSARTGGSN